MWIYVDGHLTEYMQGTCTCMHIHAPDPQKVAPEGFGSPSPETSTSPHLSKSLSKSKSKPKTYIYKTLRVADLPTDREWWAARVAQYPNVDVARELERAQDWSGIEKIKNAKIFFRNWLEKASKNYPADLTPEQIRERLV